MDADLALEKRHTVLTDKPLARSQATTLSSRRPAAASHSKGPRATPGLQLLARQVRLRRVVPFLRRKKGPGLDEPLTPDPGPGADRGSGVADRERRPGEGIERDGDRDLALGECDIGRQRIARPSPLGQA